MNGEPPGRLSADSGPRRKTFQEKLRRRAAHLQQSWLQLTRGDWKDSEVQELYRCAHAMAGTAGLIGAHLVGQTARELELALGAILTAVEQPDEHGCNEITQLISALSEGIATLGQACDTAPDRSLNAAVAQSPGNGLVFLADDDGHLAQMLACELERAGYQVQIFTRLPDFKAACCQALRPAAIIMDMVFPDGENAGASAIAEMKERCWSEVPVIFTSVRDDIDAHLLALRAGATHYISKPIDLRKLINTLDKLTSQTPAKPYRVLLVDDDELLAAMYAALLDEAGMITRALADPLQALDAVSEFQPDVIVTDVYMPGCSGLELATILRQHDSYTEVPIIFVSSETDLNRQLAALDLGADDFLTKPVDPAHLVSVVRTRAKRARHLGDLVTDLRKVIQEKEYQQFAMDQHAIVSIADKAGNIIYANAKFCEASGYTLGELLGRNHRIVKSDRHSQEYFHEMWSTIARGRVWQGEICNRRKNGSHYWVEATIVPFLDDNGHPYQYVSVRTDITELKNTEEALQESDERLRRSQVFANIGTWDWNIRTGELYWSERIGPLFGYQNEVLETSYDNFLGAVHPDDRQNVIDAVNACMEKGEEYDIEHRVIWPDGTVRYLHERGDVIREDDGSPLRMLGVVQDISERKRTEQALTRFRAALDSSADAIYLIDYETLRYEDSNRSGWETLGYSREELLMLGPQDIMPHFSRESLRQSFSEIIQGTVKERVLETTHRRRDGSEFPVEIYLHPLSSLDKPTIISLARDVTERKKAESELISAKEEAEKANQAKSRFLSSMSHELRTPMNVILGFAQLLEIDETPSLTIAQKDSVQEILRAGRHLLELINDVLDLAKIEAGRINLSLEAVEFAEICRECLNLVAPLANNRGIEIVCKEGDCRDVVVRADRTRLKQVLLNVLSNAIKYNREKGCITLTCTESENRRYRIAVSDTGAGIPVESQTALFEPFNRLGAEGTDVEGTGIGLVISKQLVELMGGCIGVESVPDEGSTFWIELARDSIAGIDETACSGNLECALSQAIEKRYTVLYIEDNPANQRLVSQLLDRLPQVGLRTAHTAALGLELARVHRPDLILLDIQLPGMDGYAVLRRLREQEGTSHIPVVALTANATERDFDRGRAAGFDEYLTKPIDVSSFFDVMERMLVKQESKSGEDTCSTK